MSKHHTHERIIKLARKGLSHDSIARKIGRPGDVERVQEALDKDSKLMRVGSTRNRLCEECRVNCVEFEADTVCAWCIAKRREEEEK